MKKILTFVFVVSFLSFLSGGCNKAAPETIETNLGLSLPEIRITEEGNITLAKEGLEKEFLLQTSFIHQDGKILGSPTSNGMQSRIVFFKPYRGSLFMMESTEGLLTSDELPSERILAEFKIVEEKDGKITFDFNEGMRKIFMVSDWHGSDFEEEMPLRWKYDVSHSLLKTVERQNKRILIRQIAQVDQGDFVFPVEVVYYLEPYQANPNFKPVLSPGFERLGFFETQPTIRPEFGTLENNITKWSLEKPIVYSISTNTPEEFRETIKEGVLYWNKVFGAKIVRVEMAPKGVTAPNPDYNIIQWLTNHYGNYAYADAQMDPRTGEMLHAQIYIPSMWTVWFTDIVDRLQFSIGLKGFTAQPLCEYTLPQNLSELVPVGKAYKKIPLQLVRDLLRVVVAHEVGHTLGLRHNFAGSVNSDWSPKEISRNFETYLKTGALKNSKRTASTVMDYATLKDDILNGAYIGRSDGEPLPYDAMAIRWAYYGVEPKVDSSQMLFCADSAVGDFDDCLRFDSASHPLSAGANDWEENIKSLPRQIAIRYLAAKTYFDPQERNAVEKVALDAGRYTNRLTAPLSDFLDILRKDIRPLAVLRQFPSVTDVNKGEVGKATTRWLDEAISSGGGIRNLLQSIGSHSVYEALKQYRLEFETIVNHPDYREGTTAFGEPYRFSDEELAVTKENAAAFFDLLQDKVMRQITEILVGSDSSKKEGSSLFRLIADWKGLETALSSWAEFVITDGAEKKPTFDGDLRLLATDILSASGPVEEWQKENRKKVLEVLLKKLEVRFGIHFELYDPGNLSKEEEEALLWELRIVRALSPDKNPPSP